MSLLSALSISASGMSAQRQRTELLVENLANSDTTRTPEGGPYRRKDAVFTSDPSASQFSAMFENEMQSGGVGVRVAEVAVDLRDPEKRYLPGHPDADKEGYVAYPRMNPAEDMVDLMGASRNYQANVSAISAVKAEGTTIASARRRIPTTSFPGSAGTRRPTRSATTTSRRSSSTSRTAIPRN